MKKDDVIEILSVILVVCVAIIYFILNSSDILEQFPIKWFIGIVILGVIVGLIIRRISRERPLDIYWVENKARKILNEGRIKNQKRYWLVRLMLYKKKSLDAADETLYDQIKSLDMQSEDLIDRIRTTLNKMKAAGGDRISPDELYKEAHDTRQVVKRKYESALMSWGLRQEKTSRGSRYYDLTNYVPF
jgi:hypothetical protein